MYEMNEPRMNETKRKADVVRLFIKIIGKSNSWVLNKKKSYQYCKPIEKVSSYCRQIKCRIIHCHYSIKQHFVSGLKTS